MWRLKNKYKFAFFWLLLCYIFNVLLTLIFCPEVMVYFMFHILFSPLYYAVFVLMTVWYFIGKYKLKIPHILLALWFFICVFTLGYFLDQFRGPFFLYDLPFQNISLNDLIASECREAFRFSSLVLSSFSILIVDFVGMITNPDKSTE